MSLGKIARRDMKVFVVGGGYQYVLLMHTLGYSGAKTVEESDIVLFTGGEDVTPSLYGEQALVKTHSNKHRDEYESDVFRRAVEGGKPCVGICRGGQFLNVMNGGKMWQHVDGHCGNHKAWINVAPFDGKKRRIIEVTSTHHQMMIPTKEAVILCTALESSEKMSFGKEVNGIDPKEEDVEACFYTGSNSLCFQPHPEFTNAPAGCVDFFEECLENWVEPMITRNTSIIVPAGKVK